MKIPIFCQVAAGADRLSFRWSDGSGAFEPYSLTGQCFVNFWNYAQQARDGLRDLAQAYADGGTTDDELRRGCFQLARAGHALYRQLFRPDADYARVAGEVRQWLSLLRAQESIESLEVVLEGARGVPWNVLYDEKPDEKTFLAGGDDSARWLPFWGVRYNLAGGRRVNPLRRLPLLKDPHVLLVVDPFVRDRLPDDQRRRLAEFAARPGLTVAESRDQLEEALRRHRPDLMYWFCHARPEELVLGDESISPGRLLELLQGDDLDGDRAVGGLAFFNACRTAEAGKEGSFFDAVYNFGMSGLVATEQQTVDTFANPFGLDFLEEFLKGDARIGELLHRLRCGGLPLGLLYALYCPPHIKVGGSKSAAFEVREKRPVPGGTLLGPPEPAQLPETPYRPLFPYDRGNRALFVGRGREVEAFAELLDADATRLVVLHGACGVGKSSFLRAGVIPYLEEECYGYGFLREPADDDGRPRVLFLRATGDPVSQLAAALLAFCARPVAYPRPAAAQEAIQSAPPHPPSPPLRGRGAGGEGEGVSPSPPAPLPGVPGRGETGGAVTLDLRTVLAEQFSGAPDLAGLRAALCADPSLLGRLLAALAGRLPYVPVLVVDQGEEMFTLPRTPGAEESQRAALEMLRRLARGPGGFRVVVSMRTEHCALLLDGIARGPRGRQGVREFFLPPLDEARLVEVVLAPAGAADADGKYRLRFEPGVPEALVRRVQALAGRRQDSVLVLLQTACLGLYRSALSGGRAAVGEKDLGRFLGDPDLLGEYAEGLVDYVVRDHRADRDAMKRLLARLYQRQPGGALTTALVPAADLAREWTGKTPFEEVLRSARQVGLLRDGTYPTADGGGRRCLSLGHDSLARVAADWDRPPCCGAGAWKKATLALALVLLTLLAVLATVVVAWGFGEDTGDGGSTGAVSLPDADDMRKLPTYLAHAALYDRSDPNAAERAIPLGHPAAPPADSRTVTVRDPAAVRKLGEALHVATRPGDEIRLVVPPDAEAQLLGSRTQSATTTATKSVTTTTTGSVTKLEQWLCDQLIPPPRGSVWRRHRTGATPGRSRKSVARSERVPWGPVTPRTTVVTPPRARPTVSPLTGTGRAGGTAPATAPAATAPPTTPPVPGSGSSGPPQSQATVVAPPGAGSGVSPFAGTGRGTSR